MTSSSARRTRFSIVLGLGINRKAELATLPDRKDLLIAEVSPVWCRRKSRHSGTLARADDTVCVNGWYVVKKAHSQAWLLGFSLETQLNIRHFSHVLFHTVSFTTVLQYIITREDASHSLNRGLPADSHQGL